MKPSEKHRQERRKATILIGFLVLLFFFVMFVSIRSNMTGLIAGKVYEMDLLPEDEGYEGTEQAQGESNIFISHKLAPDGFYVRYYNNGNKNGKVCDCFSFGDVVNPEGWVYTKACVEVDAFGDVTIKLPREEIDRMHRSLFGKGLEKVRVFGSTSLGWCLPKQEVDYGWVEAFEDVPLSKADNVTACWEKDGSFVCRECFFGPGDKRPSKCREIEREFKSAI